MSKVKTIQKEKTLIESVVDDSKEITNINRVITLLIQSLASMAICRYRAIDTTCVNSLIKEYRRRVRELKSNSAAKLKAFYTSQFMIIDEDFHLTTAEMQAGFISVYKTTHEGKKIRCILFLSSVTPDFLDTIEEGEIREYTEELEKNYLSHCKPVWTPSSLKDIYLEALTNKRHEE